MTHAEVATRTPFGHWTKRYIAMNLFWFANNFHWIALISVVIPAQVVVYFGNDNKSAYLPLIIVPGTAAAIFVNPFAGAISDYLKSKLGRRRPFMIAGTIFNVLALVGFALAGQSLLTSTPTGTGIVVMLLLFLALQISNNFANSPWSAIIADQVPAPQRGSASGWYGLMTLLGTIGGFLFAGTVVHLGDPDIKSGNYLTSGFRATFAHEILLFYLVLAAVQTIFVVITVLTVQETPLITQETFHWRTFAQRFRVEPRKHPDFFWVLFTRLLMLTGIWSINNFLLYYFIDVLKRPNAAGDLVVFSGIYLSTSIITTLFGGSFSDRVGRKPLVYLSGVMMTVTCLIFIVFQTYAAALLAGAFFGLGFGAYTSVDWALATDVLPPTDQYGKDMGIWSAAGILPQVIGVGLGGGILYALKAIFGNPTIGYSVLFGIVVVLFSMGTLLVRQVKGAR